MYQLSIYDIIFITLTQSAFAGVQFKRKSNRVGI